jgi:hypothetical protein
LRPTTHGYLFVAIETCEVLGAVDLFGRTANLKRLTDEQWRLAGTSGFAITDGGTHSVRDFLSKLVCGTMKEAIVATSRAPAPPYTNLYLGYTQRTKLPRLAILQKRLLLWFRLHLDKFVNLGQRGIGQDIFTIGRHIAVRGSNKRSERLKRKIF